MCSKFFDKKHLGISLELNTLTEAEEHNYASQLPVEVVVYLMEFLTYSDRVAASQVCQLWFEASLHPKFLNEEKVVVKKYSQEAVSVFKNSLRSYLHFMFLEIEVTNKMMDFWSKVAPDLKSLYFGSCDMYEKVLVELLSHCGNLEALMLHDCRELFMPGRLLDDPQDRAFLSKSLFTVKMLGLSSNRYLSDALLNRLVSVMPNINAISLEDCQISYHTGLFKKYYPNSLTENNPEYASETVLTFLNVYNVLLQRAQMIKNINLSNTLADSSALTMVAELENLQLEELYVIACKQLTNSAIIALAQHQTKLTVLDISHCSRITDQALLHICNGLINMQNLYIRNCRAITDLSVVQLKNLSKLEELDISQCEQVTGKGIQEGLCSKPNKRMKKLIMEGLSLITANTVICLAENLPCLTHLNLSYCFNAVTDTSVQAIFQHQLKLRSLRLANCDAVSDVGLTGVGMGATTNNTELDKETEQVEVSLPRLHISLRSKAENEIIQDALRKKAVQKMCETRLNKSSSTGYSLARLKGLQELDLQCCNKITDVSLEYSFCFLELQHLNLSQCQQITHKGLWFVGENNPSIDTLSLGHCYNVTDEGIVALTSKLRRLKYLNVKGCNKLTDISVDAIVKNCQQLRYLDASHCNNRMTDGITAMLHRLPAQTYYSKSEEIGAPPLPPPPLLR